MTFALMLQLLVAAQAPAPAEPPAAPAATLRRFALIAGSNDGGSGRVTLRYAGSDARAMSKVLTQLGGVDSRDVVLLEDPSPQQLGSALEALDARVREARHGPARVEVFFYYSGHSDEEGLLLHGERLSYAALRARLDALPVEVRIAVLDSCASGALNLLKGGAPRPSFLVDASSSLSGHAFLTSASADEAAQESERLKASIFTHYFLSGLRGAADASRDGRVTLAEAYQYAFAETLARTTSTAAGPQRPNWDIQLVGTGDLVLTDLRAADANLVLSAQLGGRVHVLSASGGLVVEVAKAVGKPVDLGLEVGEYRVVVDDGAGHVGESKVFLAPHATQTLSPDGLTATTLESTVRRGDEVRPHLPIELALVPPLSLAGAMSTPPRVNFGLGILAVRAGALDGLLIGSLASWVDDAANGIVIGGVFTKTGPLRGLGVSGVLLISAGDVTGLTASTIGITSGNSKGLHLAAALVAGGDLTGAQLSALDIVAGSVRGAQLAASSYAGELTGVQASALNIVGGPVHGAQLGVLNIGGDVVGTQIGVVNIARKVRGLQLGVVNIAESSVPVGLINVITHGRYSLAAWANETALANVAVKIGTDAVYSFVVGGANPRGPNHKPTLSIGLGLGVRHRFGGWYGEVEASFEDLHPTSGNFLTTVAFSPALRLNVGYQLFEKMAVFAGAQLATAIAVNGQDVKALSPWGVDVDARVRLVPGFAVGAQFL